MKKVIIIGAGVGGLACGIRLLHAGFQVTIYEKSNAAGGAAKRIIPNGSPVFFDNFASITIEPSDYYDIFKEAGLNPDDYMSAMPLSDFYRVFYHDGSSYVFSQTNHDPVAFEAFFGESLKHKDAFLQKFSRKYDLANRRFLTHAFLTSKDIFNRRVLSGLVRLSPLLPASVSLSWFIRSSKLKEYLLFQTFFMGVSPYRISNLYATIPAMTEESGLIMLKGGMGAFSNALLKAFKELGGSIFFHSEVTEIILTDKLACAIQVKKERIPADIVISNADYYYTKYMLLKPNTKNAHTFRQLRTLPVSAHSMSCSVFLLRLALKGFRTDLHVHNLYIPNCFKEEMIRIQKGQFPKAPPLYLYYPAAKDESFIQNDCTPLTIMMRVPNLSKISIQKEDTIPRLRQICLDTLCFLTKDPAILDQIVYENISIPEDLEQELCYTYGAAFGIAHNYMGSILFRPQIKSRRIHNLYYCGCNIHPGNGVSIVLKGAKILADQIRQDYMPYNYSPS